LNLGVDVARGGEDGNDETAVAPRRGAKVFPIRTWRGLSAESIAAQVIEIVRAMRGEGEQRPAVKVDACGKLGLEAVAALKKFEREIEVFAVDVSSKPRLPLQYVRLRDELWFGLQKWLRDGGAIPDDAKLQAELISPGFKHDENGKLLAEKKDRIRQRLKRSPDRADAVILAVYEPPRQIAEQQARAEGEDGFDDEDDGEPSPYDRRGRGPSPYGGGGASPYGRRRG